MASFQIVVLVLGLLVWRIIFFGIIGSPLWMRALLVGLIVVILRMASAVSEAWRSMGDSPHPWFGLMVASALLAVVVQGILIRVLERRWGRRDDETVRWPTLRWIPGLREIARE